MEAHVADQQVNAPEKTQAYGNSCRIVTCMSEGIRLNPLLRGTRVKYWHGECRTDQWNISSLSWIPNGIGVSLFLLADDAPIHRFGEETIRGHLIASVTSLFEHNGGGFMFIGYRDQSTGIWETFPAGQLQDCGEAVMEFVRDWEP